ncbi:MAG: hypothetical protein EOP06_13865 [Proteobacteria bacterium]|nr:MAG: hypothetical protein EOP06_13865 [Pseudomonadota bacterium]
MKAEESLTNYFSYVKNVLGVRTIKMPADFDRRAVHALRSPNKNANGGTNLTANSGAVSNDTNNHSAVESVDLLFLHLKTKNDSSIEDDSSRELLDKMIQAMRLGVRSYAVHEITLADEGNDRANLLRKTADVVRAPFVVIFSSDPIQNGLTQNLGLQKFLETFSPPYLLANAAAKKVTWSDLQKVMRELGIV